MVFTHVTWRQHWCTKQYKMLHGICIKIEFGSQRRERLLFLYTNMAAVTAGMVQNVEPHRQPKLGIRFIDFVWEN